MKTLDQSGVVDAATQAGVKPRIARELKFATVLAQFGDDWSDKEVVAVADKAGRSGVLLLQPGNELYAVPFELAPLTASASTGRAGAVICDFCYTWQRGSNAGSITLQHAETKRGIRFLCCGDLQCSANVRSQTKAATLSRTQLRESLDDNDRVARLQERLLTKVNDLALHPLE